jgi:hypothetical protein
MAKFGLDMPMQDTKGWGKIIPIALRKAYILG